jgi:signal transduction histidine kinase
MRAFGRLHNAPPPELAAPDTAAAVLMIVLVLLCWRTRRLRLHDFADVVAVVIGVVCLQVLLAYGYHVVGSGEWSGFRQIAPHSTLALMLLAFTAAVLRPTPGMFAAMTGSAQSALQLRRLIPTTLLLCSVLGWLHVLALREQVAALPDVAAWTVVGAVVLLSVLLFITSADLRRVEATVEHRQQELLQAKSAAEAGSAAKSRFMSVMSHELRTPLTAVIGYADLLHSETSGELPVEAQAHVHRIRASGWHLLSLIDAILLFAEGQLPVGDTRQERVDVAEMLRDTLSSFETEAARKGLSLRLESPADAAWVTTDPRRLRQILINLIENAVKFTARGGVTVSITKQENDVAIAVTDTGIGIDAEHLAHIWEPFQLVDATHTRTHGGVGLGLAVTRQLAVQLGARLSVTSLPGVGSTFAVQVPGAEARQQAGIVLHGTRVLVVDDETGVRRIMARTLTRYGAHVTQAESAQQALDCVATHGTFDVLVTDISMPGMTGIELAQQLSRQSEVAPVLFVTGAELDAADRSNIEALDGRLLRKPFDMVELARTVASLAGR